MNPDQGFEERQWERKVRGRVFRLVFAILALSRRISDLEVKQSYPANHRWRVIGFFIPPGERAI